MTEDIIQDPITGEDDEPTEEELGYDPDKPRPEGTWPDGLTVDYDMKVYNLFSDTYVYRISMTLTGGAESGGQTIHRYMDGPKLGRLRRQGYELHELYYEAEERDSMEYFLRRAQAVEAKGGKYWMDI